MPMSRVTKKSSYKSSKTKKIEQLHQKLLKRGIKIDVDSLSSLNNVSIQKLVKKLKQIIGGNRKGMADGGQSFYVKKQGKQIVLEVGNQERSVSNGSVVQSFKKLSNNKCSKFQNGNTLKNNLNKITNRGNLDVKNNFISTQNTLKNIKHFSNNYLSNTNYIHKQHNSPDSISSRTKVFQNTGKRSNLAKIQFQKRDFSEQQSPRKSEVRSRQNNKVNRIERSQELYVKRNTVGGCIRNDSAYKMFQNGRYNEFDFIDNSNNIKNDFNPSNNNINNINDNIKFINFNDTNNISSRLDKTEKRRKTGPCALVNKQSRFLKGVRKTVSGSDMQSMAASKNYQMHNPSNDRLFLGKPRMDQMFREKVRLFIFIYFLAYLFVFKIV